MADYAKKSFGMFRGKETSVKMLVNNSLAGVIIDRFGKDGMMILETPKWNPIRKVFRSVSGS